MNEPNATTIITKKKPLTGVRATSGKKVKGEIRKLKEQRYNPLAVPTERTVHQAGCRLLKTAKP